MKHFYIKIQVKPPKGYKNKSYKGISIGKTQKEAIELATQKIKEVTKASNPGLDIQIIVKDVILCNDFIFISKTE